METKISIAEYPYEMFCKMCKKVTAYLKEMPEVGSAIEANEKVINVDGTMPKPGDEIKHDCPPGARHCFDARPRKSECCDARMVAGGVQCEACGSNGQKHAEI